MYGELKHSCTALLLCILFTSCDIPQTSEQAHSSEDDTVVLDERLLDSTEKVIPAITPISYDTLELRLIHMGLVNVALLDSNIRVDLRYSTTNNFLGIDMYGDLHAAYLYPDVASALTCAQEKLTKMHPGWHLVVFDAVRPLRFQQAMWDTLKMPINEKTKYLSNPRNGSIHNYGAAVDLSIVDEDDSLLDMGTRYDHFGELAYPRKEFEMLEKGRLTEVQLSNRRLLRNVMVANGFNPITTEWWHFNFCSREEAKSRYKLIN